MHEKGKRCYIVYTYLRWYCELLSVKYTAPLSGSMSKLLVNRKETPSACVATAVANPPPGLTTSKPM